MAPATGRPAAASARRWSREPAPAEATNSAPRAHAAAHLHQRRRGGPGDALDQPQLPRAPEGGVEIDHVHHLRALGHEGARLLVGPLAVDLGALALAAL